MLLRLLVHAPPLEQLHLRLPLGIFLLLALLLSLLPLQLIQLQPQLQPLPPVERSLVLIQAELTPKQPLLLTWRLSLLTWLLVLGELLLLLLVAFLQPPSRLHSHVTYSTGAIATVARGAIAVTTLNPADCLAFSRLIPDAGMNPCHVMGLAVGGFGRH